LCGVLEAMKFTGHERDLEGTTDRLDDLDYMRARYYNQHLGRFLSVDPIGGSIGSIQSFNRYAYVGNSPMNFVDPFGLARRVADQDGKITFVDEIVVSDRAPTLWADEGSRAWLRRRLMATDRGLGVGGSNVFTASVLSSFSEGLRPPDPGWITDNVTVPGPWGSPEAAHTSDWRDITTWNDIGQDLSGGWDVAFKASYGMAGVAAGIAGGMIAAEAAGVTAFAKGGSGWHYGLEMAGKRNLIHIGRHPKFGVHTAIGNVGPMKGWLHIYAKSRFPFVRIWLP
jgi:RHS repeat-associated protein